MEIQISDIEIPSGRELRTDITALADSISHVGLLNPITVQTTTIYKEAQESRDGYSLVAGLHRLEAVKSLGYETIMAVVVELEDLKRDLAEIDENLVRLDIPVIDQADRMKLRQHIYEGLGLTSEHGGDRKSAEYNDENQTAPSAFWFDTAEKTGMSERSIQELTQISKNIGRDLKAEIRSAPLAYHRKELIKLARIKDHKEQRAAALAYIGGEADTIVVPKKRPPTKTARQQSAEEFAELLMELRPEVWPQVCTHLQIHKATVLLSAFRKMSRARAA